MTGDYLVYDFPLYYCEMFFSTTKDFVLHPSDSNLAVNTARHFTEFFQGLENANIKWSQRLWAAREEYQHGGALVKTREKTSSVTRVALQGPKRVCLKARKEKGRRCSPWVKALYSDALYEFDGLRKLDVKIILTTSRHLVLATL